MDIDTLSPTEDVGPVPLENYVTDRLRTKDPSSPTTLTAPTDGFVHTNGEMKQEYDSLAGAPKAAAASYYESSGNHTPKTSLRQLKLPDSHPTASIPFYHDISPNYSARLISRSFAKGAGNLNDSTGRNTTSSNVSQSRRRCDIPASMIASIGAYYDVFSHRPSSQKTEVTHLLEPAAEVIAGTVEFRLRLIIQEALEFRRHSIGSLARGNVLSFSNVIDALEVLRMRVNPDSDADSPTNFVLGAALGSCKYADALPANATPTNPYFPRDIFMSLWNLADTPNHSDASPADASTQVSTDVFASQPPQKQHYPIFPTLTLHWISVDGRLVNHQRNVEAFPDHYGLPTGKSRTPNSIYHIQLRPPDGVTENQIDTNMAMLERHAAELNITGQTERVQHTLSREHLLLLGKLRSIFRRPFRSPDVETSKFVLQALDSVRTSPGLRQLAPYLIHFACQQIYAPLASPSLYVANTSGIRTMLRVLVALVQNRSLQLHLYVHQIAQAIQTVVLHPLLGCKGITVQESSALRYVAAATLAFVAQHFVALHGAGVGGLVGQTVASVYRAALQVDQPIPTLLGAVIGLRCLGKRALQAVLLPVLPTLAELVALSGPLEMSSSSLHNIASQFRTAFLIELLGAVSDTIGNPSFFNDPTEQDFLSIILPMQPSAIESLKQACDTLSEVLGDTLTPFLAAGVRRSVADSTPRIFPHPLSDASSTPKHSTCEVQDVTKAYENSSDIFATLL